MSSIALTIVSINIKSMTIHTSGNLLICLTNVLHVTTFTFYQINNILRRATCWKPHFERRLSATTGKNIISFNNIFYNESIYVGHMFEKNDEFYQRKTSVQGNHVTS